MRHVTQPEFDTMTSTWLFVNFSDQSVRNILRWLLCSQPSTVPLDWYLPENARNIFEQV